MLSHDLWVITFLSYKWIGDRVFRLSSGSSSLKTLIFNKRFEVWVEISKPFRLNTEFLRREFFTTCSSYFVVCAPIIEALVRRAWRNTDQRPHP